MAVATKDKLVSLEDIKYPFDQCLMFRNGYSWESNIDLNTKITTGIYYISEGLTNAPKTSVWGVLCVYKNRHDSCYQIVHSQSGLLWQRDGNPDTGIWRDWYQYVTTATAVQRGNWMNSTVSFYDAIHSSGADDYYAIALDNLHSNISSYANEQVHSTKLASGGPMFGVTFFKLNDTYYGGTLFGYYGDYVFAFAYGDGVFRAKFL